MTSPLTLPPPPTADGLQVDNISSLAAALDKVSVEIPMENLLKAIHDEDEVRRVKATAEETQRRAPLSTLALQPTEEAANAGLNIITVSKFVSKPTEPTIVDPLTKERRRRLVELTKEVFPDGEVPNPFASTYPDVAANNSPRILASSSNIVVTSLTDQ